MKRTLYESLYVKKIIEPDTQLTINDQIYHVHKNILKKNKWFNGYFNIDGETKPPIYFKTFDGTYIPNTLIDNIIEYIYDEDITIFKLPNMLNLLEKSYNFSIYFHTILHYFYIGDYLILNNLKDVTIMMIEYMLLMYKFANINFDVIVERETAFYRYNEKYYIINLCNKTYEIHNFQNNFISTLLENLCKVSGCHRKYIDIIYDVPEYINEHVEQSWSSKCYEYNFIGNVINIRDKYEQIQINDDIKELLFIHIDDNLLK